MSTVEELLAALQEAENAGDDGSGEGEVDSPANTNSAIKAVRDRLKAEQKARKEAEKELEELRAYRAQAENAAKRETARGVFEGLGLPAKQADLFLKVHEGEVTADAIREFIVDNELGSIEGVAPADQRGNFEPGGGSATPRPPGTTQLSDADATALRRSDPGAYLEAVRGGRVKLETTL